MRRRQFIKTGAMSAAALACPMIRETSGASPDKPVRPNILVFFTDDHAQWAQQAYGNSELQTPNMNRIAAQGTRMTRAFATTPVCSPSRASFFTGRMPSQHGIHDWLEETGVTYQQPDLTGQVLISELMKESGYYTGLVGKWHCGAAQVPKPGFDYWFSYWLSQHPHRGKQDFSDQGRHVIEQGQQSPFLTDRAIEFLRQRRSGEQSKNQPFFLFVGYVDTHSPHEQAPDDLVKQYEAATFRDIPKEKFPSCHGRAWVPVSTNPEVELKRRQEYYAAVSSVDREVGKVLAELEANGELENTLIVYTGDHGLNAGHHGIWEKGNCTVPQNFLEESTLVPCIVSWPTGGIRQNVACDDFVNQCDLWATLLDVVGATPKGKVASNINSPGVSYLPQLRGTNVPSWRKTIMSEYGNARMARNERYKLIRRYPFKGVTFPDELYDLQKDPRETVNVHSSPDLQNVVHDLSAELDAYFAKYTVPGHDGLDMEHQPQCTSHSSWIMALQKG